MELGECFLPIYKAKMKELGLYECKCGKNCCSSRKNNMTLEKASGLLMIIDSYFRKR